MFKGQSQYRAQRSTPEFKAAALAYRKFGYSCDHIARQLSKDFGFTVSGEWVSRFLKNAGVRMVSTTGSIYDVELKRST